MLSGGSALPDRHLQPSINAESEFIGAGDDFFEIGVDRAR